MKVSEIFYLCASVILPAKRPQESSTDFITDSRTKTDGGASLGRNVNEGLTHRALRKAACSVRGSDFDKLNPPPSGWRNESNLFDFHELRQGLRSVPPIQG
jgi:hypothetical protein